MKMFSTSTTNKFFLNINLALFVLASTATLLLMPAQQAQAQAAGAPTWTVTPRLARLAANSPTAAPLASDAPDITGRSGRNLYIGVYLDISTDNAAPLYSAPNPTAIADDTETLTALTQSILALQTVNIGLHFTTTGVDRGTTTAPSTKRTIIGADGLLGTAANVMVVPTPISPTALTASRAATLPTFGANGGIMRAPIVDANSVGDLLNIVMLGAVQTPPTGSVDPTGTAARLSDPQHGVRGVWCQTTETTGTGTCTILLYTMAVPLGNLANDFDGDLVITIGDGVPGALGDPLFVAAGQRATIALATGDAIAMRSVTYNIDPHTPGAVAEIDVNGDGALTSSDTLAIYYYTELGSVRGGEASALAAFVAPALAGNAAVPDTATLLTNILTWVGNERANVNGDTEVNSQDTLAFYYYTELGSVRGGEASALAAFVTPNLVEGNAAVPNVAGLIANLQALTTDAGTSLGSQ